MRQPFLNFPISPFLNFPQAPQLWNPLMPWHVSLRLHREIAVMHCGSGFPAGLAMIHTVEPFYYLVLVVSQHEHIRNVSPLDPELPKRHGLQFFKPRHTSHKVLRTPTHKARNHSAVTGEISK